MKLSKIRMTLILSFRCHLLLHFVILRKPRVFAVFGEDEELMLA